jgi:nucleotide-binding universal stress UspA family protein
MYKTILVPLDGSKRGETILPHVKNLSLCFNAKVIFFIVAEPPLLLEYDEVVDMSKYLEKRDHLFKKSLAKRVLKFKLSSAMGWW